MPPDLRDGPYLNMAVICERVLKDTSGNLSLIDILERITFQAPPGAPEEMPPVRVKVMVVISLIPAGARGKQTVRLRPETPAGMNMPELAMPIFFEGEHSAATAIVSVPFTAEVEGLYWFDIFLEEKRLTRIPLQILYHRVTHGPSARE